MTHDRARINSIAVAVTIAACVAMMLILIDRRGIWLDETASFLFSWRHSGVDNPLREFWVSDVHPPLFSAYAWLLAPLFGERVQEMRLINLGGLFYAALVWRRAWRGGLDRDFLLLLAVLTISTPFAMLYAAEFRSYFLQLVLGACLIVQLRMIDEGRAGWPWLALTALLLINLHYFGSLIGLILLAVGAVRLRAAYRPRAARALLAIMALSVLPLVIALIAMLMTVEPVAVNRISALQGLMAIGAVAGVAALNIAALALLIWSERPLLRGFARALAGALVAITAAYFLLNLVTHNLLPRHMIGVVPIGAALLAFWLEGVVKARRWIMPLICANALLLAGASTYYGLSKKRWESNVPRIEAAERACPQSRLYGFNAMSLLPPDDELHGVPHIDDLFALTYILIANDIEIPVTIVPDGDRKRTPDRCPALLWIEHLYARPGITDLELARIAGFAGPIKVTRLQRGEARALLAIGSDDH